MQNKNTNNDFDTFISTTINALTTADVPLSGMKIRRKFEEYSNKYSVKITHTSRNQGYEF